MSKAANPIGWVYQRTTNATRRAAKPAPVVVDQGYPQYGEVSFAGQRQLYFAPRWLRRDRKALTALQDGLRSRLILAAAGAVADKLLTDQAQPT